MERDRQPARIAEVTETQNLAERVASAVSTRYYKPWLSDVARGQEGLSRLEQALGYPPENLPGTALAAAGSAHERGMLVIGTIAQAPDVPPATKIDLINSAVNGFAANGWGVPRTRRRIIRHLRHQAREEVVTAHNAAAGGGLNYLALKLEYSWAKEYDLRRPAVFAAIGTTALVMTARHRRRHG